MEVLDQGRAALAPAAPTESATAESTPATTETEQVVNYHFPVEVVMVGVLEQEDLERISQYVMAQLDTALAEIE